MKRKMIALTLITSLFLTACSNPFADTEATAEEAAAQETYEIPILKADQLQEDTYYIKHGDEFYEIGYGDYSGAMAEEYVLWADPSSTAGDPERNFLYEKDKNELTIPTMYQGDSIVYKSSASIRDRIAWERYADGGYTIGIRNIGTNELGVLEFQNDYTSIVEGDTKLEQTFGMKEDDQDEYDVYNIESADGKKLTAENVNLAGCLTGLPVGKDITFHFYLGTKLIPFKQQANYRLFYNFENYWTDNISYSEDGYAVLTPWPSMKSGYYKADNSGLFRYIDKPYSEKLNLSAINYNQAYFALDDRGNPIYQYDQETDTFTYN